MASDGMPSSRARLPAARAAAISISGTIGSVSSICRSAVAVMSRFSSAIGRLEGEKQRGGGLDPLRDSAELVERQKRDGVDGQHAGEDVAGRERGFEPGGLS